MPGNLRQFALALSITYTGTLLGTSSTNELMLRKLLSRSLTSQCCDLRTTLNYTRLLQLLIDMQGEECRKAKSKHYA